MLPLFVIIFFANKIWIKTLSAANSIFRLFGIQQAISNTTAIIITACFILVICIVSGILLRVAVINKLRNRLDQFLETKIPGYAFYKKTVEEKISKQELPSRPVILVNIDGLGQPAVIVEEVADGRLVVFVSSECSSTDGRVYLVNASAVTRLGTTEANLQKIIKSQGKGLAGLVQTTDHSSI